MNLNDYNVLYKLTHKVASLEKDVELTEDHLNAVKVSKRDISLHSSGVNIGQKSLPKDFAIKMLEELLAQERAEYEKAKAFFDAIKVEMPASEENTETSEANPTNS